MLWLLLAATWPGLACTCVGSASPCSAMNGSVIVFVGRVIVDSGEGWGSGPARLVIEEPLHNVPGDLKQADVDTSAGTSCYYRLRAGERYVIYARPGSEKTGKLSISACSSTFNVRGNEHILDALRNQARGGAARLVGVVRRSQGHYSHGGRIPGAVVAIESDGLRQETLTDGEGVYQFHGLPAGRYRISVRKAGFEADVDFNRRWSGRLIANSATGKLEPDNTALGAVDVAQGRCEVWDLGLWPNGRVSGTVRDEIGRPLAGVTLQAFAFDQKGEMERQPLHTAVSDRDGKYLLDRLPGGDYAVGVNARRYKDEGPYPPTLYSAGGRSSEATRIHVLDGQETNGVDLTLPPRRTPTSLRVRLIGSDGTPYAGVVVTLANLQGVQRWRSNDETDADGWVSVPAYMGEEYTVRAYHVNCHAVKSNASAVKVGCDEHEGTLPLRVVAPEPEAVIILRLREPPR